MWPSGRPSDRPAALISERDRKPTSGRAWQAAGDSSSRVVAAELRNRPPGPLRPLQVTDRMIDAAGLELISGPQSRRPPTPPSGRSISVLFRRAKTLCARYLLPKSRPGPPTDRPARITLGPAECGGHTLKVNENFACPANGGHFAPLPAAGGRTLVSSRVGCWGFR